MASDIDEKEDPVSENTSNSKQVKVKDNKPNNGTNVSDTQTTSTTKKVKVKDNKPNDDTNVSDTQTTSTGKKVKVKDNKPNDDTNVSDTQTTSTTSTSKKVKVKDNKPNDNTNVSDMQTTSTTSTSNKVKVKDNKPNDNTNVSDMQTTSTSNKVKVKENKPNGDSNVSDTQITSTSKKVKVKDNKPNDDTNVSNTQTTSTTSTENTPPQSESTQENGDTVSTKTSPVKGVTFGECPSTQDAVVDTNTPITSTQNSTQPQPEPAKQNGSMTRTDYEFLSPKPYAAPGGDDWNCCNSVSRKLPFKVNKCSSQCCLKFTFILLFGAVILGCAVVSKMTLLFTATQMNPYVKIKRTSINETAELHHCAVPVCIDEDDQQCSQKESVRWVWSMFFIQCIPYLIMAFRCLLKMCFKTERKPHFKKLLQVLGMETIHMCGMFILLYTLLPYLDVFLGVAILCSVALLPSILTMLQDNSNKFGNTTQDLLGTISNLLAFFAQLLSPWILLGIPVTHSVSEYQTWGDICITSQTSSQQNMFSYGNITTEPPIYRPVITYNYTQADHLPVYSSDIWKAIGVMLVSLIYWENFANVNLVIPRLGNWLDSLHKELVKKNAVTYFIVGIYRSVLTFILLLMYYGIDNEITLDMLFNTDNLYENKCYISGNVKAEYLHSDWLVVSFIQILVGVLCFFISDLAIKGDIQIQSFTLPLALLSTPLCYVIMFWPCAECGGSFDIGTTFYWNCNSGYEDAYAAIQNTMSYMGLLLGLVSFMWVNKHVWNPANRKLTQVEKIFSWPFPCGALLEQSLMLLRRSKDKEFNSGRGTDRSLSRVYPDQSSMLKPEPLNTHTNILLTEPYVPTLKNRRSKGNTFIYFCATMWHEKETEMLQLLCSLFRMNNDQVCRTIMKDKYEAGTMDYYEFEVHVFFDDAYTDVNSDELHINEYVSKFVNLVDEAARSVLGIRYKGNKPVRYDTAYGGKLMWTMPFKENKIILHLKNKKSIRKGKRWSQIMYMHYILGQCIKSQQVSDDKLADVAENTYIMALDGDVDFKPESVILLLDLMKSNPKVGAACGRIHPIGSGPMVWYQKFEYSISHWLQKATEHVLGCVLCSPGCFSLFRASALMGVVEKYQAIAREPYECVQYDQGEDRWLCTLLLQNGYRVEYCAAADAFTFAPEGFDEFFKQRRRWITSTFANLIDLLSSGRTTAKNNNSISYMYIIYQGLLFTSSILGPGTLFLMIVSTLDFMINLKGQRLDFIWILIIIMTPFIIFMMLCFFGKKQTQLTFAAIMSTVLAVLQVLVLVGVVSEVVNEGGACSPTGLLLIFVLGSFLLAAILHPQECMNLLHLFMFYLFVPSAYLLLLIYSICNVNDVSWGTRDTIKASSGEIPIQHDKAAKLTWSQRILSTFSMTPHTHTLTGSENSGCSFSCKPLFGCRCCITPGGSEKDKKISNVQMQITALGQEVMEIKEGIDVLVKKKERKRQRRAEMMIETGLEETNQQATVSTNMDQNNMPEYPLLNVQRLDSPEHLVEVPEEQGNPDEETQAIENKFSFNQFPEGTINPESVEMKFWDNLVKEFLYPIDVISQDDEAKLKTGLNELRNKSVFAFFIINIIIIVLVLGLKQVGLHIDIECGGSVSEIDPVGIAFIFVFGLILMLQLFGMLVHRLYTVVQLISNSVLCVPTTDEEDENGKRKAITDENLLDDLKKSLFNGLEDDDQMELVKDLQENEVGEPSALKSILKRKGKVFTTQELNDRMQERINTLHEESRGELGSIINLGGLVMKHRDSIFVSENQELIEKLSKRRNSGLTMTSRAKSISQASTSTDMNSLPVFKRSNSIPAEYH